jgi:hypothetical protein
MIGALVGNLIDHLESYLGTIGRGWQLDSEGTHLPFQVAEFSGGQISGVESLATIGLSNVTLEVGQSGLVVCNEFLMMHRSHYKSGNLPTVLQEVSLECLASNRTFLRGDVIGPRGTLIDGYEFTALYVARPVYLPDGFAVYKSDLQREICFIWLVPIVEQEVKVITRRGWEYFERRLEAVDPDLTDLRRDIIRE